MHNYSAVCNCLCFLCVSICLTTALSSGHVNRIVKGIALLSGIQLLESCKELLLQTPFLPQGLHAERQNVSSKADLSCISYPGIVFGFVGLPRMLLIFKRITNTD